jgi:hypothetical protein
MNVAPMLARFGSGDLVVADDDTLAYWAERWDRAMREIGAAWSMDEAAEWARDVPGLAELLVPQRLDGLLQGHVGMVVVEDSVAWAVNSADLDGAEGPLVWDEAVEIEGGRLLVYPQDGSDQPYVVLYAAGLLDGAVDEEPVRLTTVAHVLRDAWTVPVLTAVLVGSDGSCGRWLVQTADGRTIECRADGCSSECSRTVRRLRGGVRAARCTC